MGHHRRRAAAGAAGVETPVLVNESYYLSYSASGSNQGTANASAYDATFLVLYWSDNGNKDVPSVTIGGTAMTLVADTGNAADGAALYYYDGGLNGTVNINHADVGTIDDGGWAVIGVNGLSGFSVADSGSNGASGAINLAVAGDLALVGGRGFSFSGGADGLTDFGLSGGELQLGYALNWAGDSSVDPGCDDTVGGVFSN